MQIRTVDSLCDLFILHTICILHLFITFIYFTYNLFHYHYNTTIITLIYFIIITKCRFEPMTFINTRLKIRVRRRNHYATRHDIHHS
jgi:hypothetical protein